MIAVMKKLIKKIKIYTNKTSYDLSERNRFLMISISLLILLDYLLFCFISNRNPLMVLPSIPIIENKKTVNVYVPDTDGKNIIKELRSISIPENTEGYARLLIEKVIKGSNIENTSIAVPVELFIRKIWFNNETCIIDFIPSIQDKETNIIQGSEKVFVESIEKTITGNIPSVKKIAILDNGIPGRNLWE